MSNWMVYGANGYTGVLIAELARQRGMKPVLAGRTLSKVQPLAERLGFEARAFSLEDPAALAQGLSGVKLVAHCAGPFSATSKPMLDACLAQGVHYLDITGEVDVIGAVLARADEVKQKGIVAIPAVGFDVVPTDCLAAVLAEALPGATSLSLAFATKGKPSQGTAKTAIEGLPKGGLVRRGGKLTKVPAGSPVRRIPFHHATLDAMAIPWGDLASAAVSTGIGDITVYMAAKKSLIRGARLSNFIGPILGLGPVQRLLKSRIEKGPAGPSADDLARQNVELWGEVRDASGKTVEATLTVPGGYVLTAESTVEAAQRVLLGKVPPGAWTPSLAFGKRYVTELSGTTLRL
ncbi:MAG: saccharopine dehydrogenase NADP-binding domain-containing protein, partial [Deltaproteobacteria bacterium]|nr:saccharopine dehydrogenase NADP-binding domain-containing protein [Deltaproteobacteria bacterium]